MKYCTSPEVGPTRWVPPPVQTVAVRIGDRDGYRIRFVERDVEPRSADRYDGVVGDNHDVAQCVVGKEEE